MSDIVIAGCAGFLGSNLSNYLVQHTKLQVVGIDNLTITPDIYNLQFAFNSKTRFDFYLANAQDAQIIGKFFEIEKPKVIVYNILTAHLLLMDHGRDPNVFLETLRLWLDLAYLNASEKFIVLAGSEIASLDFKSDFVNRVYELLMSYQNKLETIFINHGELFGPRQRARSGLAQIIVQEISGSGPDSLTVVGNDLVDLIYVKDMFSNVLNIITSKDICSGAYSIHGPTGLSKRAVRALVKSIICDEDVLEQAGSCSSENKSVKYPITNYVWQPKYELSSAIEHTIVWYDSNRWAWR